MKIAVVLTDPTAAEHIPGARVEHYVRVFDMPTEMAEYVEKNLRYNLVFALVEEK